MLVKYSGLSMTLVSGSLTESWNHLSSHFVAVVRLGECMYMCWVNALTVAWQLSSVRLFDISWLDIVDTQNWKRMLLLVDWHEYLYCPKLIVWRG